MRIEKVDHIHIYVKDLESAIKRFSDILGTHFIGPIDKRLQLRGLALRVAFDELGLELISPVEPSGPDNITEWIDKEWLEKHGEGLACIAFKVPDIEEAIAELEAEGVRCRKRGIGMRDLKAAIFSPENTHGVII